MSSKEIKKVNEIEMYSKILASYGVTISTLKNRMEMAEHSTDPIIMGNLQRTKDAIVRKEIAYKVVEEYMNKIKTQSKENEDFANKEESKDNDKKL